MKAVCLSGLNPQQRRAAGITEGRLLILAGAGSGKTRVLTYRMAHLVQNLAVPPSSILGVTFTNKAAREMRHRLESLIGPLAKEVTLSTFHSFCMQVLRKEIHHVGFTRSFSLYDEQDILRLVKLIARDLLGHESELPSLADTMHVISMARNRGLRWDEIPSSGKKWWDQFNADVYRRLEDSMRAYNALDFDSLLTLTVRLFEEHPEVLERYQERYRHIMIDEYQDTNPVQYRLAELLSAKYGNLCVVGDDDQSIYGWRGAEVKNILSFSGATTVKLEQNYRSTNSILTAANAVIKKNTERHDKVLWSERGEGEKIEVFVAPTEECEAEAVVHRLAKLKQSRGLQWRDIAILYRSNALSRSLEAALMRYNWQDGSRWVSGIPYQIYGGTEFFQRKEVKDLLAYLRVVANSKDDEAILRVVNQPRRGIGEQALGRVRELAQHRHQSLWVALESVIGPQDGITRKAAQGMMDFVAAIRGARSRLQHESIAETLSWMAEKVNYRQAIAEEVKSAKMRAFKWENVEELISAVSDFEDRARVEGEEPELGEFLAGMNLVRDEKDRKKNLDADTVSLMTFHSSKGLEFPACFLVGLEDHILPHSRSEAEGGVEEERRLMYVAITRAMTYLCCSMASHRKQKGKLKKSLPSRFMHEIPKELLRPTKWDS